MKYMGSKARLAKQILPLILQKRGSLPYNEPFVGGCNMIDKVEGLRSGSDANPFIAYLGMFLSFEGWVPPKEISRDFYNKCRDFYKLYKANGSSLEGLDYPSNEYLAIVGYVGVNGSYSGKFFGGYAGIVETKGGTRNYPLEAYNNVIKQKEGLIGADIMYGSYDQSNYPSQTVIYCDPPYAGTTKYANEFDSEAFWEWCRDRAADGHLVYVSEYTAPDDFVCIWRKSVKSSLSANGTAGGSKCSTECLFVHKTQVDGYTIV